LRNSFSLNDFTVADKLVRWIYNLLSPAGTRASLSVLIFHRVLPAPDPLFPSDPDAGRFETQLSWMKDWFNVLSLPEAVQRLARGVLPERAAAITFDDGYKDNCTIALPILKRLGLPATFFIATGFLNDGRMFNDTIIEALRHASGEEIDLERLGLGRYGIVNMEGRRQAIKAIIGHIKYLAPEQRLQMAEAVAEAAQVKPPSDLMMNHEEVRGLANAGMTIGAHTVSHPILLRVSEREARTEMAESKEQLQEITGGKVTLFAYPNGKPGVDYTAIHVQLARQVGFEAACSTGWGAAHAGCDIFQIPRFTPWDRQRWRYAIRLARNLRHSLSVAH
jgi:peptidoglycan/xylan/chitin deacetylase (PgdA/CDA1 family)